MKKDKKFSLLLTIGVVNAVVLYAAALYFPTYVVVGNEFVENWMAVVLTALLLTVLMVLVKPVMKAANLKAKGELSVYLLYGAVNIAGLWVLARLAKYVGFGVSSFVVVIVLGVVLTLLQLIVWKGLAGKKGRK